MQQWSLIRENGAVLAANGYPVVAIQPNSKIPVGKNWQKNPLSESDCRAYPIAECGVGVLNGIGENPLCVLDIDADDVKVVDAFVAQFRGKNEIIRTGRYPRVAIFFKADKESWPYKGSSVLEKNGLKIKLEVRSHGQTVCYGTHPDTQKPYIWNNHARGFSLMKIKASDLPVITEDQADEAIKLFEQIASSYGYKLEETPVTELLPADITELDENSLPQLTIEQAREYVLGSGFSSSDYDEWLQVGMALHDHFSGSEEALNLWNEWSSQAENYVGLEDCRNKWESFGRFEGSKVKIGSIIKRFNLVHGTFDNSVFTRALADKVHRRFRDTVRKDDRSSNWFVFNGTHWEKVTTPVVIGIFRPYIEYEYRAFIEKATDSKTKEARKKLYERYLQNAVKILRDITALYETLDNTLTSEEDFDTSKEYFGVANGDVELSTGALLPPNPKRMISKSSPVKFDVTADCPLWEKTLKECLVHDDVVAFFQRLVGYTLTGNPTENKMVFLHGYGCNGKSTIMSVLKYVFGGYSVSMYSETLVSISGDKAKSPSSANPDVVLLKGARLAVAEELDERAIIKSASFKRLAGVEVLRARNLYEKAIEFRPTFTIFLCTNHLPKVEDGGDGMWRRPVLIDFPRNFERDSEFKKDVKLQEKLIKEASGILNWALKGLEYYNRQGLNIPKRIGAAINRWRGEEDIIGSWIEERVEASPNKEGRISLKEMYADFKIWANESGQSIQTANWFGRRLKEKGFEIFVGKAKCRYIKGYKLIEDDLSNPEGW